MKHFCIYVSLMDIDSLLSENAALKRKLGSKTEALLILHQELNKSREERDFFKSSYENRHYNSKLQRPSSNEVHTSNFLDCSGCKQLPDVKTKYLRLHLELEDLKDKLNNAQGDIKVLRNEKRNGACDSEGNWHGREALVASLESATSRAKQLEADIAGLLDEKQELVSERDAYRCKLHRLNHQITSLLRAPNIDIDALIMENKYLQERLDQSLADKEILQQNISKYKAMLEKKRNKGSVQLGTTASCEGMVVTHKQVQDLLEGGRILNTEATVADLRSLCLAMLESLQDKSTALAHHKKTNKILANRISDLEAMLTKQSTDLVFPSRLLMEGYSSSNVDKDVEKIVDDVKGAYETNHQVDCSTKENDLNKNSANEADDILPPELQELVLSALQDLKKDSSTVL